LEPTVAAGVPAGRSMTGIPLYRGTGRYRVEVRGVWPRPTTGDPIDGDPTACRGRACPARRGRTKRRPYVWSVPWGASCPKYGPYFGRIGGTGVSPVNLDRQDACPTSEIASPRGLGLTCKHPQECATVFVKQSTWQEKALSLCLRSRGLRGICAFVRRYGSSPRLQGLLRRTSQSWTSSRLLCAP